MSSIFDGAGRVGAALVAVVALYGCLLSVGCGGNDETARRDTTAAGGSGHTSLGGSGGQAASGGIGAGGSGASGGSSGGAGGAGGALIDPEQVPATEGDVKGYPHGEVWNWRGIPYAAPPIGDLRWRAPRPPEPHAGLFEARSFGNACPGLQGRVVPGRGLSGGAERSL